MTTHAPNNIQNKNSLFKSISTRVRETVITTLYSSMGRQLETGTPNAGDSYSEME
jgi:hypothetical protein